MSLCLLNTTSYIPPLRLSEGGRLLLAALPQWADKRSGSSLSVCQTVGVLGTEEVLGMRLVGRNICMAKSVCLV